MAGSNWYNPLYYNRLTAGTGTDSWQRTDSWRRADRQLRHLTYKACLTFTANNKNTSLSVWHSRVVAQLPNVFTSPLYPSLFISQRNHSPRSFVYCPNSYRIPLLTHKVAAEDSPVKRANHDIASTQHPAFGFSLCLSLSMRMARTPHALAPLTLLYCIRLYHFIPLYRCHTPRLL